MSLQKLFQRLALVIPGTVAVVCDAIVISRQNGRKVKVNGTFTVEGAITVRGIEGTTILILRSSRGKDYLINWRYSDIREFNAMEYVPCMSTLRRNKPAALVWDTLGVRGTADTVRSIRERTINNGGKLF